MEDIALAKLLRVINYLIVPNFCYNLLIMQLIWRYFKVLIYLAPISPIQRFFADNICRDTQNCNSIYYSINGKAVFYTQLLQETTKVNFK